MTRRRYGPFSTANERVPPDIPSVFHKGPLFVRSSTRALVFAP